jgi:hypothetical protein
MKRTLISLGICIIVSALYYLVLGSTGLREFVACIIVWVGALVNNFALDVLE